MIRGTNEKELRFEFVITDPTGAEHIGRTPEECEKLITALQEKWPKSTLLIRAWHWSSAIVLPQKNPNFAEQRAFGVRERHALYIAKVIYGILRKGRSAIRMQHLIGGILDAIEKAGIDFSNAKTENNIENIMLKAFGKEPESIPDPWAHQVVFEFKDGVVVLLMDALADKQTEEQLHRAFALECARRRKKKLSTDGFIRPRQPDDDIANGDPIPANSQLKKLAKQSLDSSGL